MENSLDRRHIYDEINSNINWYEYYQKCWHHIMRRKKMLNLLKYIIRYYQEALVLDAGCGDGWYTELLDEMGLTVIGLDISRFCLARCKTRFKNADFVLADVHYPPFKPISFDLIIAAQLLEHIEVPDRVVKVLSNLLKPNGRIVIETPCRTNLTDHLIKQLPLLKGKANWGLTIDPTHKHFFSIKDLIHIIKSQKLSIEKIQGLIHFNYSLPLVSYIVWHVRILWFLLDIINELLGFLRKSWGAIVAIVARKS